MSTESSHEMNTRQATERVDTAPEVDEALTPEELVAQWAEDAPPPAGPWANLASALVFVALGVTGLVISLGLGLGTPSEPEPGMWPFLVSLVITVLALTQLAIGRRGGVDGEKFSRHSWQAGFGLLTLLAMVWLMPRIGFEIPGLLLSFVWMKFLGGETWRSAAGYSLILIVAFYVIFVGALGTDIPHLF